MRLQCLCSRLNSRLAYLQALLRNNAPDSRQGRIKATCGKRADEQSQVARCICINDCLNISQNGREKCLQLRRVFVEKVFEVGEFFIDPRHGVSPYLTLLKNS